MKKFLLALILALFIMPQVHAIPIAIGEPVEVGSWTQRFQESGVGNFNELGVVWLTGSGIQGFESPVFRNFSAGGWSNIPYSQWYAEASGPTQTYMEFDIAFLNNSVQPLSFLFRAADNGITKEVALANWNGGGWSFAGRTDTDWNNAVAEHNPQVPEPGTMMLLGSLATGFFSFAGMKKKFNS